MQFFQFGSTIDLSGFQFVNWTAGQDEVGIYGTFGADTLIGSNVGDIILGYDGADIMVGNLGDDIFLLDNPSANIAQIHGSAGRDFISGRGGDGLDIIDGGEGADTIEGGNGIDIIDGGNGADTLRGNNGADTIDGGAGNDVLYGGLGFDSLDGGAGNDVLDGGIGYDMMVGGLGNDTYFVDAVQDVVFELAGEGYDSVISTFDMTLEDHFEELQLTGAARIGTGNDASNRLVGSSSNDTLYGLEGDDEMFGSNGADTMFGGAGNDTYFVDDVGDMTVELAGEGYDRVFANSLASWTLAENVERLTFQDSGNHTATGNALDNRLDGNAGDDIFVLDAGGADVFSGGQGQDTFDARAGTQGVNIDLLSGTHGGDAAGDSFSSIEVFWGSNSISAGDVMLTGAARAKFFGFRGDDILTGGATVDYLDGGVGNDTLNGMGARDGLRGFTGDDILTGGSDRDYFQYVFAGFDHDTITDYQDGLDYLRVFSAVADEVSDFTIAGNGTSSVMLTLNDGTTDNTITINGDGGSNVTIDAGDFLFY
ncbi:hypothetical protein ACFQ14_11920 [Pseudahrensia aquimaris]|uniref:Calcium-binding protein n=1 Tax=Pseudahrensia aquimaris TaxID=744461 RepID=A0ABW3FF60_9HYPH